MAEPRKSFEETYAPHYGEYSVYGRNMMEREQYITRRVTMAIAETVGDFFKDEYEHVVINDRDLNEIKVWRNGVVV